jgi:hypothetical protein
MSTKNIQQRNKEVALKALKEIRVVFKKSGIPEKEFRLRS